MLGQSSFNEKTVDTLEVILPEEVECYESSSVPQDWKREEQNESADVKVSEEAEALSEFYAKLGMKTRISEEDLAEEEDKVRKLYFSDKRGDIIEKADKLNKHNEKETRARLSSIPAREGYWDFGKPYEGLKELDWERLNEHEKKERMYDQNKKRIEDMSEQELKKVII